MKNLIIFLFLLFQTIFNSSIPIENFENVTYPVGTSEFTYQFSEFNKPEGRDIFFYFNFTNNKNIQFYIINENNINSKITIYSTGWTYYSISNLKSQIYTFKIINNGNTPGEMTFIDGTKEINTNIFKFINLNFSTINLNYKPTLPLIFNIAQIEEDIFFNYKYDTRYGPAYESDNILNYCEVDENENKCEYKGSKALSFKKGKKYKIKFNLIYYSFGENFCFEKIIIKLYNLKEINDCYEKYEANEEEKTQYFILNSNNHNYVYIYIKSDYGRYFYYQGITKEQKNELIIDDLRFNDKGNIGEFKGIQMKDISYNYDALVLRIHKEEGDNYQNIIYKFFELISINSILNDFEITLDKRECAFIGDTYILYAESKYIIVSSDSNLGIMDIESYSPPQNYSNIILFDDYIRYSPNILVNSFEKQITCKGYKIKTEDSNHIYYYYSSLYFNFIFNKNLTRLFNKYQTDYTFRRFNNYVSEFGFNTSFFFDINQDYYLYIKKYHGNSAIYKYSQAVNSITDLVQFQKPYFSYENSKKYELINNELVIISGYQLFTFIMNYNSLYDIYFQKVNDCEFVYLNRDLFPTNNLVKLFSENKHYYLNFTLDHLIKLDTNFLDANVTFTDENGTNYILNKDNKIIKDLRGNNIKLTTDKKALLYFYYRIENYTDKGTIVLDKSTKGKNIKFEVKNSKSILIKDICFKGYYPMLTNKSWQTINNNEVYVENIIDNLEYDLYEGENYIIYIFDSYDENNFPILIDNEISNITMIIY